MTVLPFYAISALIALSDQLLKHYISGVLPLCVRGRCESIELLPFFKLTVLHNEGAAFSFLDNAGGWQRWFLVTVSSVVSVVVAVWLYRVCAKQKLLAVALCLILGGAIGNLVDRAYQGYVVDFFVLYYESYYFPAFNIADAAISVGAAFLILDMLVNKEESHE